MIDMRLIGQNGILVLALAAGVTAYILYNRIAKHGSTRVDANTEDLYLEISGKLAEQMQAPQEQILSMLRQEAQDAARQDASSAMHLECTFRKLSAVTIEMEIVAAFLKEGKPMTSTLRRQLSWDDLPANVRSDFIHTSLRELHYSLGSNI